jgi:hypothetical protein
MKKLHLDTETLQVLSSGEAMAVRGADDITGSTSRNPYGLAAFSVTPCAPAPTRPRGHR